MSRWRLLFIYLLFYMRFLILSFVFCEIQKIPSTVFFKSLWLFCLFSPSGNLAGCICIRLQNTYFLSFIFFISLSLYQNLWCWVIRNWDESGTPSSSSVFSSGVSRLLFDPSTFFFYFSQLYFKFLEVSLGSFLRYIQSFFTVWCCLLVFWIHGYLVDGI